ncbi:MAG TPA: glycoside hydrolase family 52 protein, partial [Pontiella sp.]|nr:glycoside hydrolase family 52 protein [Pontiella sp.]
MNISRSFHAQHSPMGAHSSFTLGMFGAEGGMALGKGGPAGGGVYVGYRTASGKLFQFPFFKEEINEDMERFVQSDKKDRTANIIFDEEAVSREYKWATDCFRAPGIAFSIATPFFPIPDPSQASADELKFACCPAIFLTLSIDNTSEEEREGFFALENEGQYWSPIPKSGPDGLKGFMSHDRIGFATQDEGMEFCDFNVERALQREHTTPVFRLGSVAGIVFRVPAGERREIHLALGGYLDGPATFNYATRFWYTRHFAGLLDVLAYALENRDRYLAEAAARDTELAASGLSEEQQFLIAHATRSYYGSTEWLTDGQ